MPSNGFVGVSTQISRTGRAVSAARTAAVSDMCTGW